MTPAQLLLSRDPRQILHAITVASKPDEVIVTTAGSIPYLAWLELELTRITRKQPDWPLEIYHNPNTREVSLVHLRTTGYN